MGQWGYCCSGAALERRALNSPLSTVAFTLPRQEPQEGCSRAPVGASIILVVEQRLNVESFIQRWQESGAAERANYQLFLSELCDLLGVVRPDPSKPEDEENAYVFERSVTFHHPDGSTSTGRIDLYKRGCFILEAKQGVEKKEKEAQLSQAAKVKLLRAKKGTAQRGTAAWDEAMLKARGQAEQYARALPASEGRPPFLVVVDVGHSIELYSEFTRTGGNYVPFPDPRSHRFLLEQLGDKQTRETLRLVWTDPLALDPARRSARVTREIAEKLGRLAQSLEASKHSAEVVATFLMRALFTMFAEDMELLPKDSFLNLLESLHGHAEQFVPMVEELWGRMKTGGFSTVLREKILRFNGGLFENATALPLNDDQFELLIEASRADWRDVEPAIFGTLLERALNPVERHRLGAHYTPRSYVERLVLPTVVEPLRAEWDAVKAAAVTLDRQGNQKEAAAEVQSFHRRLCEIRVLDPACGTGNFLYVTLEHLKRLEGEVFNALDRLGHEQAVLEMAGFTVDPHQLLGLEVNPRAAAIAELVLWIGYLQWHFRTRGRVAPPEPIIKNFRNIECRDAVLAYDRAEPVFDANGQAVTRWDGRTLKKHPVTGESVPDEAARVPLLSYVNPRPAEWPAADFIVGNPPFIGNKRMRQALGDGYVETLRKAWHNVPETVDFVMYWWQHAADLLRKKSLLRFGFITTNSITQSLNRKVLSDALNGGVLLLCAIPDHPWVDSADGAAVRVAMTVAGDSESQGLLLEVEDEKDGEEGTLTVSFKRRHGAINPDLTVGANAVAAVPLLSNKGMSFQGVIPLGDAFRLSLAEVTGLGFNPRKLPAVLKRYMIGRDVVQVHQPKWIIDFFGRSSDEARRDFPALWQRVFDRVKPERDQNNRPTRRINWWLFGENAPKLRRALGGLKRFIVVPDTSKFKPFVFLGADVLPDVQLYCVVSDDAWILGVLQSQVHQGWLRKVAPTLEDRPRWKPSIVFEPFPFPAATAEQQARIRKSAEALDVHRKQQQAEFPTLTLTETYNVLEKVRAETPLGAGEKLIHNQALVSVLRTLHDELDAAVADAYAISPAASDEEILTHLCNLNAQRAAEERKGLIRWLRPAYQNPATSAVQTTLATDEAESKIPTAKLAAKLSWPNTFPKQAQAVRSALYAFGAPISTAMLVKTFKGAKTDRVDEIMETLASLGQARALSGGRYVGV